MQMNSRLYERLALLDYLPPATAEGMDPVNGAWIAVKTWPRILGILSVGTAQGAGIEFQIQKATSAAGAGATTAKAAISGTADNKQYIIEVAVAALGESYTHVRMVATPNSTSSTYAALLFGGDSRYGNERDFNIASLSIAAL